MMIFNDLSDFCALDCNADLFLYLLLDSSVFIGTISLLNFDL